MIQGYKVYALSLLACMVTALSCTHKGRTVTVKPDDGNYPADVAGILVGKCATAGCHNNASYQNAGGLLLDTWGHMLQGSVRGAQVVPYSTKYSTLLYYVNTDPALGSTFGAVPGHIDTPLTKDEYMVLVNWIAKGAPDKNGTIPFASDAETRQKMYLAIGGCDLMAVIDAQSKLVMRYIPIGSVSDLNPHSVRAARDGSFVYVTLYNGGILQKIDMRTDTVTAAASIRDFALGGTGLWSAMTMSPMDTALLVSGWTSNGCVLAISTATMQRNPRKSADFRTGASSLFQNPHGVAANKTFDTFYATLQHDVIKYTFNSSGALIYHKLITASGAPHEIEMMPDQSKYFVTCPKSSVAVNNKELRVYDAHTDTLLKAIPMGTEPLEIAFSPSRNLLFVTCAEDNANPTPGSRGSVYVVNCSTLAVEAILYGDFFQPHGIAIDEQNGLVFIASRNVDPTGPAPHHTTSCAGRPGWYTVYDLNTLKPADTRRHYVPSDPYTIAPRFKP